MMDPTEKLKSDLHLVHRATLIIESSRGIVNDLCMAQIRVGMISAALHIIHRMRNQQRAELANGHMRRVKLIGIFADIADDMLDTALGIHDNEGAICASQ